MGLKFRRRDYREEESAHALVRTVVDTHPLSTDGALVFPRTQVNDSNDLGNDFSDPLRAISREVEELDEEKENEYMDSEARRPCDVSYPSRTRNEWSSLKKILMQRFPAPKTIPMSMVSSLFAKSHKATERSSRDLHSGDFDEDKIFEEESVQVISQQECFAKFHELKYQMNQSWHADDRVTSLRLSIKAARLLMNTSMIQFYPNLFVLVTDIMDMLGDLVWNRINQKAEANEQGAFLRSLPDSLEEHGIHYDAKETCKNWFSKIGAIRELLPRIYLELALLPCWCFVYDNLEDILQRLVLMTRGIAHPLASSYCFMYLVQCAQRLPRHGTGYLSTCIDNLKLVLVRHISSREVTDRCLSGDRKLMLTLIDPSIEYITRCLLKDMNQTGFGHMLKNLFIARGNNSSISIILHHVLKELPIEYTCSNAVELLNLVEHTDDYSFDQCLNYRLLGHRLCEKIPEISEAPMVADKIIQVLSTYNNLDAYLMVADAYVDIILEKQLDRFVKLILDGVFERIHKDDDTREDAMLILQSLLLKLVFHCGDIEKVLALNHFVEILDVMRGSSRSTIDVHILSMATRSARIQDPSVIEVLFEVALSLYDGIDFSNMRKDDYQNPARVITSFVYMVDYGTDVSSHLHFLARCRGAFPIISELQNIIVHLCNKLAVEAMRYEYCDSSFVKSCLAFNEVTIPAIPSNFRQLNLYLEIAEVALLGGFFSHADGLIDSVINNLRIHDTVDGLQTTDDADGIITLLCKLCGILVMVPGDLEQGVTSISKDLLAVLDSLSWVLPRMKTKVLCSVLVLLATLSQSQLPYHEGDRKAMSNNKLFYGVEPCPRELLSLASTVLRAIQESVVQEPSSIVRGKTALEACNCIASSFEASDDEILEAYSKLVDIAKSCLSGTDKFLQSTLNILDERHFHLVNRP